MNKILLSAVIAANITLSAQASKFELLPILTDNYQADFALAVVSGVNNIQENDKFTGVHGLELSFNCPLLTPPNHIIRQQLSVTNSSKDDLEMLNISLNPHHMFQVTPSTSVGIGPSIGFSTVEIDNETDTLFTYGLGASAQMDLTSAFFVALETRYEATTEMDKKPDVDFNNAKVLLKAGYKF